MLRLPKIPKMPYAVRRVLKVATDVVPKLPTRQDTWITSVVKMIGVADSITGAVEDGDSAVYDYLRTLKGYTTTSNPFFGDLFIGTGLQTYFDVDRIPKGKNCVLIQASKQGLGTVIFIEWRWGERPYIDNRFWHSNDFDFEACLTLLWDIYSDHMLLSLQYDKATETKQLRCGSNPAPTDPLFGDRLDRLKHLAARHLRYKADGVPRTYLYLGSWGAGKTTFAQRMAVELGGRSLTIDANGFVALSTADLELILAGTRPSALIVDDIDRAPDLAAFLPNLFITLRSIRASHPDVAVFLTANFADKIDPALNRPERIDEIEEFELPNPGEREAIILGYCRTFKVDVTPQDLARLVEVSESLSEVFLKDIALQLRYEAADAIVTRVDRRKRIVGSAKKSSKNDTPTPKDDAQLPKAT